ncbi:glycosyltransferase family 4 protein [Glaciibacter superstes]|uniref:glycosyltransferase family 4 protein n=1 Tax=Glaciibacter superstes TaxID=501023 RepID=UPI00041B673F|nr:glycosyltransferase family 4 protein [Glaciibacter superstes]
MTVHSRRPRSADDTPIRILVAHPGAELFGSDRMALASIAGFLEAGNDVVVTTPQDGPLPGLVRRLGATFERCQTPVLRKSLLHPVGLLRLAGQSLSGLIAGTRLVSRFRPDVLYVSTLTIPLWAVIGKVTRTPVVCHVHEAESTAPRWMRRALAAGALLAETVIANSEFSADVLRTTFPRLTRRIRVVYNGIDGPDHPGTARTGLTGGLRVAYVGRLSARKGVDVAIAAVALVRAHGSPAQLDIIGSVFEGNEAYEVSLHTLAEAEGIADVVQFVGFIPDVWDAYAGCDVAVVPSRFDEPFGNTAVEALLAARPVIVSDTSGLREAADGYESAQRSAPGDPIDLARALERAIAEWPGLRRAAQGDCELARIRHSPARYQALVAAIVGLSSSARTRRGEPVRI